MKTLPNITSIKEIELLENLGAEIEFIPEEEDQNIFEHFTQFNDENGEENAQYVADKYNNGNMAAWFCAHVKVKYKDFEGEDYLGACSYNSFKEFTTTENDYYQDMINQCIDEINTDIVHHNANIQQRWNIRKAKNLIAPYNLYIVASKELVTI